MKKLIMSLLIVVIAVTSCSKDETSTEVVKINSNLLSKIENTITTEGSTNVVNSSNILKYDGNKLSEIVGNDGDPPSSYSYTGDLITKVRSNDGLNFTNTSEYFYDINNKLKSKFEVSSETNNAGLVTIKKKKIIYTYNQDGTILEENFKIDNVTGAETKDNTETVYTYANENMVKRVRTFISTFTNSNNGIPIITTNKSVTTDTYLYDNKKNIYTNILGFRKATLGKSSSINNIVKETSKFESFTDNVLNSNSSLPTVRDYVFKYNENDYPIEQAYLYTTIINQVVSTKTSVSKYFYE